MLQALHTDPRYWGSDSLTWEPKRWINSLKPSNAGNLGAQLASEKIIEAAKGSFIAWSEGVRNCPGKKFAQVEFVAVMAALFHRHIVKPVPRPQESFAKAQEKVLEVVKDSKVQLLLEMQKSKDVTVTWQVRA